MGTVAIHPPKTPITSGFNKGTAKNTIPNVCKMPGPPAPFVPSPLPNIAKSNMSPKKYSKDVKIEGATVAIFGATFKSMGDMASKATGGGLLSMNTHGPAKFIVPGSLSVKIEGKAVHLLGDMVLNNLGASGAPPNTGATMGGTDRDDLQVQTAEQVLQDIVNECDDQTPSTSNGKKKSCTKLGSDKHQCCESKIQDHRNKQPPDGSPPIEGERGYRRPALDSKNEPIRPIAPPVPTGGPRPNLQSAFAAGKTAVRRTFAALRGNCFPDAAIINADGSRTFVDFKFPCPPGHPSGRGRSKGGRRTRMSEKQKASYDALGEACGNGNALTILPG